MAREDDEGWINKKEKGDNGIHKTSIRFTPVVLFGVLFPKTLIASI